MKTRKYICAPWKACITSNHPIYHSILIMNKRTYAIRSAELLQQIQKHPHKDELVNLMLQQVQDSVTTYTIPSVKTI